MGNPRTCTVCATLLPAPAGRGKPSPYCSAPCREAAGRQRRDLRYWQGKVALWEPFDPRMSTWCRARLDRTLALPATFYLDPRAHLALRS